MKKAIAILLVIVAAAGLLFITKSGSNSSDRQTPSASPDSTRQDEKMSLEPNTVNIKNYKFSPNKISVKKGTKVTWVNNDTDRHNVKPVNVTDNFKAGPLLAKGEEYSVVFNTVGTYEYFCEPHPYMKATIEVTE